MTFRLSENKEQICEKKQDDYTNQLRTRRMLNLQQKREKQFEEEERLKRLAEMKLLSEKIMLLKEKYKDIEIEIYTQLHLLTNQPNEMFFAQILTLIQTQLMEVPEKKYCFIERVIPQMLLCLHVHMSEHLFRTLYEQQERCMIMACQILVIMSTVSQESIKYIEEKGRMIDTLFEIICKSTMATHFALEVIEEMCLMKEICNMFYERHVISKLIGLLSETHDKEYVYIHTAIIMARCLDANINPDLIVKNNIALLQKLFEIPNDIVKMELLRVFGKKYNSLHFIIETRHLPVNQFALDIFNQTTNFELMKESLIVIGRYIVFRDDFQFNINVVKGFANRKGDIHNAELQRRMWWIMSNAAVSHNSDVLITLIDTGFFFSCCKTIIEGTNMKIKSECCYLLSNILSRLQSYDKIISPFTYQSILLALEFNDREVRMRLLESIVMMIERHLAIGDRSVLDQFLELHLLEIVEEMRNNHDVSFYLNYLILLEKLIRENTKTDDQFTL